MRPVALIAVLLVGCAGGGNFSKLSQSDQDRFQRCMMPTRTVRCGSDTDMVYVTFCERDSQAKYADLPSPRARMEWLVGNGCPPTMVQPERFVEGGDDRPAQKTTAAPPAPED